jgi:hypothetical protein
MCAMAKYDPDSAVPWLKDRIRTAMPHQMCVGLTAIVLSAPSTEHLKMAQDWWAANAGFTHPLIIPGKTKLLNALLTKYPCSEVAQQRRHSSG